MPAPLARGIIITVSILVAASIAAYENPHVRAWIDRTRHKVAMSLHSLGDEISPKRPRPLRSSTDISMQEEKGDAAEARRQQMRAEIMQRSRILEEKQGRRKRSGDSTPTSPSFDTLVDEEGRLKAAAAKARNDAAKANTSSIEAVEQTGTLRSRHQIPIGADLHQSVDAEIPVRQFPAADEFESRYERELRDTWNIPLPDRDNSFLPSSHASESLIDLTPTTEDFPDPEISVPSLQPAPAQSDYFSAAASRHSSHTASEGEPDFYYAHPARPLDPIEPRRQGAQSEIDFSVSSAPSVAGSTDHVHASEAENSDDDLLSEPDGIRTPASAWTEVGSNASQDA